jgi:hypothetical protein
MMNLERHREGDDSMTIVSVGLLEWIWNPVVGILSLTRLSQTSSLHACTALLRMNTRHPFWFFEC